MTLTLDEKISLLKEVGEEIIEEDELRDMMKWKSENNKPILAYDGFEPSGNIHIAQGLLRTINVNKLTALRLCAGTRWWPQSCAAGCNRSYRRCLCRRPGKISVSEWFSRNRSHRKR